jgi:hypothetical protein
MGKRARKVGHLPKRIPKYLEYAYTFVVAVSLLQIFVFAPRMYDYVTWLQGDDIYVAHQIKLIAESYLKDECINRGTSALTQTDSTGQRSSLARMASADLVQTKGLGLALCSAR